MMKALFFLNSFAGGGAERVCLNLAQKLHEMNVDSDFVTIYNKKPAYSLPEYIHVLSLEIEDKPLASLKIMKAVPIVNEFISGKSYLLITAHLQPSYLLASLTKVGEKCFYVVHGSFYRRRVIDFWVYGIGLRLCLKGKKLVTVSEGLKFELENHGFNSKDIRIVYNPCPVACIRADPKSKSPHVRKYILVMGRLEKVKNPLLALELFYQGRFYDKYDLIYLGQGSLCKSIKKQIAKYNLQEYVFLPGFQNNPVPWIKNASLLLSCSKYEGLPMNLVEALVCGIPVVAVDCPYGPSEILTGKLANYLIHPMEKLSEMNSVIASALESYPEVDSTYYDKFNVEHITQIYLSLWKEMFE